MPSSNDATKRAVLDRIAPSVGWRKSGQVSYSSSVGTVHARFKTAGPFSFNINPATLRADFELWICGSERLYYLLPRDTVRLIYDHPGAYIDSRHPDIRVVRVDPINHRVTFDTGGESLDLRPFFQAQLAH